MYINLHLLGFRAYITCYYQWLLGEKWFWDCTSVWLWNK